MPIKKPRSVLIDDDELMLTVLSDLLKENHPEIQIIGTANNGQRGIEQINRLSPDLIFLDVEMPDMNGFEMLNTLVDIQFQTIFTTAHSHYAIKAFRFNALDYLVKPIAPEELSESINRFMANDPGTNQNRVQQALKNLSVEKIGDQRLHLQTQTGMLSFPLKQIVKIEGEGNYSFMHLSSGQKELSSKTLGYFEEILSDKGFFRCHRSSLVNGLHITRIDQGVFHLTDGSAISISRRRKTEAINWFSDFDG